MVFPSRVVRFLRFDVINTFQRKTYLQRVTLHNCSWLKTLNSNISNGENLATAILCCGNPPIFQICFYADFF